MKKIFIVILLLSLVFGLTAQDFIISFQPALTSTQIDSTIVTNQKTKQKIKLLGNESLTLTNSFTGISLLQSNNENGSIYPNPCDGDAALYFSTIQSEEVAVSVFNNSGQILLQIKQNLNPGRHTFKINFPVNGVYYLSIVKSKRPYILKIISLGIKIQKCDISYNGSESSTRLKNAIPGKILNYSQGDILHYSVFSIKNNTIFTDSPGNNKVYTIDFFECSDNDKRSYSAVKIGNQVWMAENLAYLPAVSPPTVEGVTEPYYYVYNYNGTDVIAAKSTVHYAVYGVLYNWGAALAGSLSSSANPSGVRGICPKGWHLPSDAEWTVLENYLIDNGFGYQGISVNIAKSLAASILWNADITEGAPGKDPATNNKSGFSGLPGGIRYSGSLFSGLGSSGGWWSATQGQPGNAWFRALYSPRAALYRFDNFWGGLFSVRCVKD